MTGKLPTKKRPPILALPTVDCVMSGKSLTHSGTYDRWLRRPRLYFGISLFLLWYHATWKGSLIPHRCFQVHNFPPLGHQSQASGPTCPLSFTRVQPTSLSLHPPTGPTWFRDQALMDMSKRGLYVPPISSFSQVPGGYGPVAASHQWMSAELMCVHSAHLRYLSLLSFP